MRRKRAYLLLELMIAFALVGVCSLLLVGNPLSSMKSEIAALEKMELERIAGSAFADFKAELYKNQIPWKEIPEKKGAVRTFDRGKVKIILEGVAEHAFQQTLSLKCLAQKEGKNREDYRKLSLEISYIPQHKGAKPVSFKYLLFAAQEKIAIATPEPIK